MMNVDCWLLVLKNIPPGERFQYRTVNRQWRDLIDYLALSQRCLQLYSTQSDQERDRSNELNLFEWPHLNISYSEFVRIFRQYPKLRQLSFVGFTHWNDHHLIRLTELCHSIEKLAFYSCSHLGDNYFNDFGFQNVTQVGWQNLALSYGDSLKTLILEDCDLENYHLGLIVQSFQNLTHLNIANNSEITNFSPLTKLTKTIEVLKLGPKLSVNSRKNRALYNHEMPIDELVKSEFGQNIRQLQLQGCLTPKLIQLQQLGRLEHLIVKYASFSNVEDVFNMEMAILTNMAAKVKQLQQLDLYQINQSSSIDLHWLRQRLTSISMPPVHKSSNTNLHSFTLYTIDPFVVVEQFRMVDFILSSSPLLQSFGLSCSTTDSNSMHYNLNQTIFVLLQKYGNKLRKLTLENIISFGLYPNLVRTLLAMPNLVTFEMEDREMLNFLQCMDHQLNDKKNPHDLINVAKPLELIFSVSDLNRIEWNRRQIGRLSLDNMKRYANVQYSTRHNDHDLRMVDTSLGDSLADLYSSHENDLSDLCQLIDSSYDLIGHCVDFVTVCTNYLTLTMACAVILRPTNIVRNAYHWFSNQMH